MAEPDQERHHRKEQGDSEPSLQLAPEQPRLIPARGKDLGAPPPAFFQAVALMRDVEAEPLRLSYRQTSQLEIGDAPALLDASPLGEGLRQGDEVPTQSACEVDDL